MPHRPRAFALSLSVLALVVTGAGHAADTPPPVPHVKAPAIDVATLKEVDMTLGSDAFEGRAPGTPAEDKTVDYIVQRFKQAGLQPGNHGKWLQDVPTVTIDAQHSDGLTVSGGAEPLHFNYGTDMVAATYRVVPKIDIKDSDMVFVGYGIDAPELGWNDYAGVDVRGKTVVILINDPDYENADETGLFKGRRMTYYGRWMYKYEEAARQGAAAAIIIHDTFPAAYGWQVVNSSNTGPQHHVASANNGMDQSEAIGWIQKPAAEAIFKAAGKDLATLSEAAKHKGFKAVPLGLKASMSFDNVISRSISHNVIGILPGKTHPDQYVFYTAHWDHLGHCPPDKTGDDICNGALDNGSGVAALVALAEANHQTGPAARSQVFMSVTLEESGLLGSQWYAQHPVYPLDHTVGGVNMDIVLPGSPSRDVQVTGGDKSDLTRYLKAAMADMHLYETPEDHPERGHYYRSDHFSFAKVGVPMFALKRGTDWVNGGKAAGEAASEDYVQHHYHQPSDQYDPSWDWSGPVQEISLYYRLGRELAMTTDWPNWHNGDEFRAIRDKSCAASNGGC